MSRSRSLLQIAGTVAALALVATTASAQTVIGGVTVRTADVSMTQTVNVVSSLSLTKSADIVASAVAGTPVTVNYSDANAGSYAISGTGNAAINVNFTTLPGSIVTGDAAGNIALAYTNLGCIGASTAACSVFTPVTGSAVGPFTIPAAGSTNVYLGVQVSVPAGHAAGSFSTSLAMNVAYVGF